ncbi:MAG TPA: hypothetical protein VFZ48_02395 [Candidatus Saccharimonadales bacterium]
MKEFYTIYYLVLVVLHALLPFLLWLWSAVVGERSGAPKSKVRQYRGELIGHLAATFFVSALMLSFVPFTVHLMEETTGGKALFNGLFTLIFVGVAGFFMWLGFLQAKANRRRLREAQAEEREAGGR